MRKLGLRENFCCTAPEGAVGMVAMRMVQPGNVRGFTSMAAGDDPTSKPHS